MEKLARPTLELTKKDYIYWYKEVKIKKYAFRYRYEDAYGKRREKYRQGFETERAAEIALTDVKAEILRGNHQKVDNLQLKVGKWLELWYERNESNWKISTQLQYKNAIERHLIPNLGDIKLQQLTKSQYETFINKINGTHAPATVRTIHAVISNAVNAAVEDEIIPRNRIAKTKLPQLTSKYIEVGDNFLNEDELHRLLKYVKENESITHYMLVLTLTSTGMRKGEALGLRWKDIDDKKNEIDINFTRDHLGERSTKTENSIRHIDVGNRLITNLKKYKRWSIEKKLAHGLRLKDDDYIFINPQTCEPISRSFPNYLTERAFEAGVMKRITPHAFRHTCATILIAKGIPITSVAKLLGDSVEMVLKVYAHSLREKEKEAARVLDEVINFE